MIIFWIFTLFVGSSAFAFALIYLQLGIGWSIAYAIAAMLVCRGVLTLFKRWLVLSERIAPENTADERTIETNRAIFWRRILHSAHHRTQLTVYLRLLNRTVPPSYGPTADVTWSGADPTLTVQSAERSGGK